MTALSNVKGQQEEGKENIDFNIFIQTCLGSFMAYFQTCGCSDNEIAVGDLLDFALKVENYEERRTLPSCASTFKVFSSVNCYQLIKNDHEWGD